MPAEVITELAASLIEVTADIAASSYDGNKKGCGCLALIFVVAIIAIIVYCVI
jgi:hypothetical protein